MKQPAEARVGLTRRSLFRAPLGPRECRASSPREDNMYTRLLGVRPLLSVRSHTTITGGCQPPWRALNKYHEGPFSLYTSRSLTPINRIEAKGERS
jgi:hypothetical protein